MEAISLVRLGKYLDILNDLMYVIDVLGMMLISLILSLSLGAEQSKKVKPVRANRRCSGPSKKGSIGRLNRGLSTKSSLGSLNYLELAHTQ